LPRLKSAKPPDREDPGVFIGKTIDGLQKQALIPGLEHLPAKDTDGIERLTFRAFLPVDADQAVK
jgi:hypothetical protein